MLRSFVVLAIFAGCGGVAARPPTPVAAPANAIPAPAPAPEPVTAPDGYVEMQARDVVTDGKDSWVMLFEPVSQMVIPIGIGETEAKAISLRFRGEVFRRPLTHDLLDDVLKELDAELVKGQIDEVRDGSFHGSIYLRHDGRTRSLDARASDAIALALGNKVPLYVARAVIDDAGIPLEELLRQAGSAPPAAGTP
jgi:bifunctional DNase/RNase